MKVRFTLLSLALVIASSLAWAGSTVLYPVVVTINADGSGSAQGNLSAARFSANSDEFIGCGVHYNQKSDGTVSKYGLCQALATGSKVGAFCNSSNSDMLDSIKGINEASYVAFKWDVNGVCTSIYVSSQSQYIH